MKNLPITTFSGSIQNQSVQLIDARELHQALEVKTRFDIWINRRLTGSHFKENVDYLNTISFDRVKTGLWGTREIEVTDYHLTIDTAKHICLMENSEIGYKIRQKFIDNDNKLREELPRLQAENAQLKAELVGIPAFLRDPDYKLRLVEQAVCALYLAQPECKEIVRYRAMGLSNAEIQRLLGLGKKALETRLTKLFQLGVLVRKNGNQFMKEQLALGFQA